MSRIFRLSQPDIKPYPDGYVKTLLYLLAPYETPEALDRICEEYNRVTGNRKIEPLITIPVSIHDFLCIHPFKMTYN